VGVLDEYETGDGFDDYGRRVLTTWFEAVKEFLGV